MKAITKNGWPGLMVMTIGLFASCSDSGLLDIPGHELDVEFKYELTCSDMLLKYVTPEVIFTDGTGAQRTISIESGMWQGNGHKTWTQSVHYDSLNVSNTATVRFVPITDVVYQDEMAFDYVYHLSCFISIKEDGESRRNNYTVVPDFPSVADITANALEDFIERLENTSTTRGGSVDMKGEITKIENN